MRRWLARGVAVLAFWGVDLIVHRWLASSGVSVPLLWALGMAAAFLYTQGALVRVSLPLALASELGSGLPPATAFVVTLLLAHGLALLLRRPRPALPAGVRFGLAAALLAVAIVFLDGILARLNYLGPWPPARLLPVFLGTRVLLPALLGAGVAAASAQLLAAPRVRASLRALFGAEPA